MRFGRLTRAPRRVTVLFLIITILPATALAWLSWSLFNLNADLEGRKVQERLDAKADLVASALESRLKETARQLPDLTLQPTDNAVVVTFGPERIQAKPAGHLVYFPVSPPPQIDPHSGVFADAIDQEIANHHEVAIAAFRALAVSRDPIVRAGALINLAPIYRKIGQPEEALKTHLELEQLGPLVLRDGTPVDLFALKARCSILAELGRTSELEHEAQLLNAELERGRWDLDQASYELYFSDASRVFPASAQPKEPSPVRLALAEGVSRLWQDWKQLPPDRPEATHWHTDWFNNTPVLSLWQNSGGQFAALVTGPEYIESRWASAWTDQNASVVLVDTTNHNVLGQSPSSGTPVATRTAVHTGLPWTIRLASANPAAEFAPMAQRSNRLLLTGLVMMAVLTILGGGFTARAAAREFALARLQTDFVSAVSHEFRTPLTSLRHLTELLATNAVLSDDRRRQYYTVMAKDTDRLHRLVEGLLDFGRMEAGGREHNYQFLDPVELVEKAVGYFRPDLEREGGSHRIELSKNEVKSGSFTVRVNPEAIIRALRNLLENAVKYSPSSPLVQVNLALEGNCLAIRVKDNGAGIQSDERKAIFNKFVRGSASRTLNVPGTGIGLAMTQHIVHAHGGELLVESEPGNGSTFTIQIPLVNK